MGLALSQDVGTTILMMSVVLFLNSASLNGIIVLLFDIIPAEVFGTSIGIIGGLCGGLAGVMGPLLLGYLYDRTGSFFWGFVTLGLGATLGALAGDGLQEVELLVGDRGGRDGEHRAVGVDHVPPAVGLAHLDEPIKRQPREVVADPDAEPGRIDATISSDTSLGAFAPGTRTVPIRTSASATRCSSVSWSDISVMIRPLWIWSM